MTNMFFPFLSPSASKSPVQGATQPKSKYLNFMSEEKKICKQTLHWSHIGEMWCHLLYTGTAKQVKTLRGLNDPRI
jgi:hypothetical protein